MKAQKKNDTKLSKGKKNHGTKRKQAAEGAVDDPSLPISKKKRVKQDAAGEKAKQKKGRTLEGEKHKKHRGEKEKHEKKKKKKKKKKKEEETGREGGSEGPDDDSGGEESGIPSPAQGGGIWNPAVQPRPAVLKGAAAQVRGGASLALELARQEAVRGLHRRLEGCCRDLRVRLVNKMFENWLLQEGAAGSDPVLGGAAASPAALCAELREAGAPQAAAERAAAELCRAAQAAAKRLASMMAPRGPPGEVTAVDVTVSGKKARQALIERRGNPAALRAKELCVPGSPGAKLRINEEHLEKLRALHGRHSGRPAAELLRDVCCLLLRYSSLQGGSCHGGGMQSALTEEAFDVLHARLGATMECFASPLNCYWGRFCSAFPDTDCPFGSVGSFFSFSPTQGSFEANPPFEASVMRRMAAHIHTLLEAATGPMSFAVVIPAWERTEGWQALKASPFLRGGELRVPQKDHGFCEGSQHTQATRYRIATFDSSVFFLQNDAGNERWPPTKEVRDELLTAMVSKHCTVAQQMAAKQLEREQHHHHQKSQ